MNRAHGAAYLVLTLAYVTLLGHRPIWFMPGSDYDDQLFASLAVQLASGHWLGPYSEVTLIKGIGLPLFMALNYLVGLPINLTLCLLYAAASFYLVYVLRPLIGSPRLCVAFFALLLFIPALGSYATTRMDRSFFYVVLTTALFGSVVNLLFTRQWPRTARPASLLVGALGAWFWLTREEGVWLAPTLVLLVAFAVLGGGSPRKAIAPCAAALLIGLTLIGGVGLVNRLAYGRFVVNETTSAPFQPALSMLQKAAYPFWTPFVPVPLAARNAIYDASPAFRRLKPYLDPEGGGSVWVTSCDSNPAPCGDIGGGAFLWALRDAAAKAGAFTSPRASARFFRQLAQEVAQACNDGRLTCARWMAPMIPPFTRDQIATFPEHLLAAARMALLMDAVESGIPPPGALSGLELQETELFAVPQHGPGRIIVIEGQMRRAADAVPAIAGLDSTQVLALEPPGTSGSDRFTLTLACLIEPCAIQVGGPSGVALSIVPPSPGLTAPIAGEGFALTIDKVSVSPLTLRTRVANIWRRHLPDLALPYEIVIVAGALLFLFNLALAIVTRELRPIVAIAIAAGLAVAARIVLIALVDATSFSAIETGYMAACLPLTLVTALLSIAAAQAPLRRLRLAPPRGPITERAVDGPPHLVEKAGPAGIRAISEPLRSGHDLEPE